MIALNIDVSALSLNAARRVHTAWASDRAPVPSMGADGSRSDTFARSMELDCVLLHQVMSDFVCGVIRRDRRHSLFP